MKLTVYPGAMFKWNGTTGVASMKDINVKGFPTSFYVRSEKTGKSLLFLYDNETMTNNEFFDGEACAYFNPGGTVKVQLWNE